MNPSLRRRSPLLAAAVLTTLGLAACDDSQAVEPASGSVPSGAPAAAVEIVGVDYAFEGAPDFVAAGTELTFRNDSSQEAHEMVVFRISNDEDRAATELLELPEEEAMAAMTFAGVAFALPDEAGQTPEGPIVLEEPGRYALVCFLPVGADPDAIAAANESTSSEPPDLGDGPPHFVEGMVAELTVD